MSDPINHPSHYLSGPTCECGKVIEVITIAEQFGFRLGNVIKYILRVDHKGNAIEDLKKSAWYLDREIARREAQEAGLT